MNRPSGVTVVDPPWLSAVMWFGFPVLGAAAVYAVKLLAGLLLTLPWVPFEGPLRLVDSVPEPWGTVGAIALGAVAGLVLAVIGKHESLSVSVDRHEVVLDRGEDTTAVPAERVDAVFLDGKQLVLLGHRQEELAREQSDLRPVELAEAFRGQGFRWLDADPHHDAFRRWVPGTPGLPIGADALLKARDRALRGKDKSMKDARELRAELARLGVVVRDRKERQYWRLVSSD
ncbi:hypothetical protein AB0I60_03065 [Actinosynnema sp. NPDC050436]|uniref:YqeB family protein n=1 Tax=Actinosynnema sp. NPDC050436 TaxID=3155659 RepID=UPI0033EDB303